MIEPPRAPADFADSAAAAVPPRVAVARVHRQFQVTATQGIAAGEAILAIDGAVVAQPSRWSIQVGEAEHVELPAPLPLADELDCHPWRFLNHACAPNAMLCGRTLVARRAIAKGDEVTFDYTTTEYEMACPFLCGCGAPDCLGVVRGFRWLSPAQRQARAPWLAAHLLARFVDTANKTV